MKEEEIEKKMRNIAAIMSFENMDLTKDDEENIRRVLRGEATGDEVVAEIEIKYKLKKKQ